MRIPLLMLVLVSALLIPKETLATVESNTNLYNQCKKVIADRQGDAEANVKDAYDIGYCEGMINGYLSGLNIGRVNNKEVTCYSAIKVSNIQHAIDAFVGYIDSYGGTINTPVASTLLMTLTQSFPCESR